MLTAHAPTSTTGVSDDWGQGCGQAGDHSAHEIDYFRTSVLSRTHRLSLVQDSRGVRPRAPDDNLTPAPLRCARCSFPPSHTTVRRRPWWRPTGRANGTLSECAQRARTSDGMPLAQTALLADPGVREATDSSMLNQNRHAVAEEAKSEGVLPPAHLLSSREIEPVCSGTWYSWVSGERRIFDSQ
jgi:hypothetical protein